MPQCNSMDCGPPGFPVHHQLPEPTQTHAHRVGDAIQPSHPLSPSSPPAFSLFQNPGLYQWVCSSHQVAKSWSFSFSISPSNEYSGLISFRMDWLDLPCSPRNAQESSPTPQLKSINSLALSFLYPWVPLSMGFSRQEYWSVLPFSSPGDLPDAEIESTSPALQVDSLSLNHGGIQRDSMLEYSSKSDCMKEVKV